MTAATPACNPNSITCHNCGRADRYKSGCAVQGKVRRKGKPSAGHAKKAAPGGDVRHKWCTIDGTTTHSDAECYAQEASRSETSNTN